MAQRVFLHVGTMKSATSYLQVLCQANRGRLRKQGILWPGIHANFLATQDFLDVPSRRAEHKGAWAALSALIADHPDTVLISNEMLLSQSDAELKQLIDAMAPAEVSIVITGRDLARVLPSQWQTSVRSGRTTPWAEYVESALRGPGSRDKVAERFWRHHNLPEAVLRCAGLVSAPRVTLVTIPPSGADPRLTGDRFLSAVGVSSKGFEQPATRNASLGVHSAELARRLNGQVKSWDQADRRSALRKALYSGVLENRGDQEPRLALNPQQWQAASEQAHLMVDRLRDTDVRLIGELDDLLPRNQPSVDSVDPAASTAEDLLAAAEHGLIGLAAKHAALTNHLDVVVRRNAAQKAKAGMGHPTAGRGRVRRRRSRADIRRWIAAVPGARRARAWVLGPRRSRRPGRR